MRRTGHSLVAVVLLTALPGIAGAASPPTKSKAAPRHTTPVAAARDTALRTVAQPGDSFSRPSFTGRWRLSIERSTFGDNIPGGTPTARTDVIEQAEPRIRQTLYLLRGAQRDTTVYLYSTDCTPTVNKVDGRDIRSVVRWEGSTLHLVSTAKLFVLDTSLDERWRLSPDRRTLTYTRHIKFGFGEGDQRLVFERE